MLHLREAAHVLQVAVFKGKSAAAVQKKLAVTAAQLHSSTMI
jgi:hypothetical protein